MENIKPRNYWTKENCAIEALKFSSRSAFWKFSKSAYNASIKNKWIDDICKHMHEYYGLWNNENCAYEALKYNTRTDFLKNAPKAYRYATKKKILDNVCKHMLALGNLKKRCIYSAEFNNNFVYVGLTHNFNKRSNEHLTDFRSKIYKHFQITNIKPMFKQLTDYIEVNSAKEKEGDFVIEYENNGWNLLNKAKTGALGGNEIYWTLEKCHEEALKYTNRTIFSKKSMAAYSAACKNGWLIHICAHMISKNKTHGYWNKENCSIEALKYNTRKIYQENSKSSYGAALKNKWLNDICSHMFELRKNKNFYSYDICYDLAFQCKSRKEFSLKYVSAYCKSRKNNWLDEICQHMPIRQKSKTSIIV